MAETKEGKNIFNELYNINVNEFVEKKNTGKVFLSYLSWTYAWKEIKSRFPDAQYEIVKFENGLPYCYDEKTGYMVYTRVTIEGITHEMWLPVMDSHNAAMLSEPYKVQTKYSSYTVEKCTMFDVNKTIMRCLTKNLAMFGLGLYIYAGEDVPNSNEGDGDEKPESDEKPKENKTVDNEVLVEKTLALEGYIANGIIKDEKFIDKAREYIRKQDIEGIDRTIAWCKEQEAKNESNK